jgi:hypothetical protein
MTRKDKFMKAIKSKGYDSIVQLMTRVTFFKNANLK